MALVEYSLTTRRSGLFQGLACSKARLFQGARGYVPSMSLTPVPEPTPPPPVFGSTCTCGSWETDGVTHHVGQPCVVDETGEPFSVPESPEVAESSTDHEAGEDGLPMALDEGTAGLSGDADDTPD
jgi:hypothetical protein